MTEPGSDISIRGLRKSFGTSEVLHGIDLDILAGTFVGLMGPNGAGKSTLIKILAGVYTRSHGEIRYGGEPVRNLAERREVGFVHQDLGLIDDLTIVDNLRLGEEPLRFAGPILNKNRERALATRVLERAHLDRRVDTLVGQLSPGEKTLVAIARLLDRGARVLFIDEATSTLPPADARRLIEALRGMMRDEHATIVMVSHKLSEILDATNRVILLIDGVIAADVESAELDRQHLVSMLVTHETEDVGTHDARHETGRMLMRMNQVSGGRVGPIDLELHAGEVIGLTGLPGSGLHDVAHLANGTLKPSSGNIERAAGISSALLPPHRETEGGFNDLTVLDNLTISSLKQWQPPWRLIRRRAERQDGEALIKRLGVVPDDPQVLFATLSGGNKQKVLFGRALLRAPSVYVMCEPTRGVDIGTRIEIYRLINGLVDQSTGVLVVTSDAEDLFAVCDRIAVVADGLIGDFIPADETNPQELEAFV